ncbi:hypothetical protein NDU88_001025 [Pleurodeles waltl]|uniref:Uncharacterized protein n=1 Tax=Pleurodeles waltl TaxID=8319 RepID=A0AAV7LZA2_PLEWA|nr:hypothetical protein NDU88_001025 [Pleurodeles waltl]
MPALEGPEPLTPGRRWEVARAVARLDSRVPKGPGPCGLEGLQTLSVAWRSLPTPRPALSSPRLRVELCLFTAGAPAGARRDNRQAGLGFTHARWIGGGYTPPQSNCAWLAVLPWPADRAGAEDERRQVGRSS